MWVGVVVISLLGVDALHADVVSISPSKDNTLIESADGGLSNGQGHLRAGRTNSPMRSIRRSAIAFDIASAIPPGSTIVGVTLRLNMSRTSAGPEDVVLHPATADWGEGNSLIVPGGGDGAPSAPGDATWIHRFFPDEEWSTPGGDFGARSATTVVDGNGSYAWSSDLMRDDAQSWLDDPARNFGWILVGNEDAAQTVKRFDSGEHQNAGARPVLEIEFEPAKAAPASSTWGLIVLFVALLTMATLALRARVPFATAR
jgi:hypothetical protein